MRVPRWPRVVIQRHGWARSLGCAVVLSGIASFPVLCADFSFPAIEQRAVEKRDMGAPGILSLYLRYGYGTSQDFFSAAAVISPEAAGHPYSLYNMGVLMVNRAGSLLDQREAERLKEQAEILFERSVQGLTELADQQDPFAQLMLGGCYETGRGVQEDKRRAFELYHASSLSGLPVAWSNLADLLMKGQGTAKDVTNGMALMEKAAEAGVPMAKYALAQAYFTGEGKRKSAERGIALLQEAANEHNHQISQADLARFYLDGVHVRQNKNLGMEYLDKAVVNNNPGAVQRARRMGYLVDVSPEFPESFALALSGRAPQPDLQPSYSAPQLAVAPETPPPGAPSDFMSGTSIPSLKSKTPPPGFREFHQRFVGKSGQAFDIVQKAMLFSLDGDQLTPGAVFQQMYPETGRAADWLENFFASENVLLKEQSAWEEPLMADKTFAYAVVDLPQKIFPLLGENKNTDALRLIRTQGRVAAGISPSMVEAWEGAFSSLAARISGRVDLSDDARKKSQQAKKEGQMPAAIASFREAMSIDYRDEDKNQLAALEEEVKRRAFLDTGL